MKYERICPECKKTIIYSLFKNLDRARKNNLSCKSCCQIGKNFSDEHRKRMSQSASEDRKQRYSIKENREVLSRNGEARYSNPEERKKTSELIKIALHRPDIRKRHVESMVKVHFLGNSTDIGCHELIKKWSQLGFKFELNYQVHTDDFLCYLDGYDPINNVVLEYDSKYHNSIGQKKKDLIRQNKIIDILHPKKFWRYNSENKTWKNVMERN